MKNIKLKTENKISNIYIGSSILEDLENYISDYDNIIIITDSNVDKLYKSQFPTRCKKKIVTRTGEKIKTLETVENIYNKFLEFDVDRSYFIIGIGGGIVCDIAGFAASTYIRGLKFGFVSTTLLSQVDASVGGKNGVNFKSFKNMIGTFNQPEFVICDINMLNTLTEREFINGLGEVIKHSLISNENKYFDYLENNYKKILDRTDKSVLEEIIYKSIIIKSEIVKKDEKEVGERKKLNFGHTFGHAIEVNEKGLFSHGEAVSLGIMLASKLSLTRGFISKDDYKRIEMLLSKLKLPIEFTKKKDKKDETNIIELLLELILKDKKRVGDNIDFIFLKSIGEVDIKKISFKELRELSL